MVLPPKLICDARIPIALAHSPTVNIGRVIRSLSGILEIAIMMAGSWEGSEEGTTESFSCKYDCYYCPDQPGMPRSYVAEGPSARRALQWNFETVGQFHERA